MNTLAYFSEVPNGKGKKEFCSTYTWGQCYKTFYGRSLWIFVISLSVFHGNLSNTV